MRRNGTVFSRQLVETPRLIPLPATATGIVQISASFAHAAFVTETGQMMAKFSPLELAHCGIIFWFVGLQK